MLIFISLLLVTRLSFFGNVFENCALFNMVVLWRVHKEVNKKDIFTLLILSILEKVSVRNLVQNLS